MRQFPAPEIIAELGPCLVINKPGGLLTQGPPGIDSLEIRIKRFLKARDDKPGKVYLGVPHRLDRPASGVMLFAKHVRAAQRISKQFQNREIEKTYWAVVEGLVEADSGRWSDHMRKIPDRAQSEISEPQMPGSQEAILEFNVLDRRDGKTWLEIHLLTGRTHQIRLQTSHRGHPILGDQLYGASTNFGPASEDLRQRWIALHARRIGFEHPMTREAEQHEAALSEHWQQLDFDFSAA